MLSSYINSNILSVLYWKNSRICKIAPTSIKKMHHSTTYPYFIFGLYWQDELQHAQDSTCPRLSADGEVTVIQGKGKVNSTLQITST